MADNEKVFTDLHDVLSQQNILMESIATKIQLIESPQWKKVPTESETNINLPKDWNELQIIVHEDSFHTNMIFNISRLAIKTVGEKKFTTGWGSTSNPTYSAVTISEDNATLSEIKINNTSVDGKMVAFYK